MNPIQVADRSKNIKALRRIRSNKDIESVVRRIRSVVATNRNTVDTLYSGAAKLTSRRIKATGIGHKHTEKTRKLTKHKSLAERLAKNYKALSTLYASKVEINAVEAFLLQDGIRNKDALMSSVLDTQRYVYKANLACLRSIHTIASKYCPRQLVTLTAAVKDHLESTVPASRYSAMSDKVFVSTTEDRNVQKLVFHSYINIRDLMDDDEYVIQDYYIILSCSVDDLGNATYHVTSFKEFKMPGTFPVGTELASIEAGKSMVDALLNDSSIKVREEFKVNKKAFKSDKILFVDVSGKSLLLTLASGVTALEINEILTDTLPKIHALLGDVVMHRRQILHRVRNTEDGRVIEFMLDRSELTDKQLDPKMQFLRSTLRITDDDYDKVRDILSGVL